MRFPRRRRASDRTDRREDLVCQEAVELMSAYLEDELSPAERARLEGHLAGCAACTEYLGQMRATVSLLGRGETPRLSPTTSDALREVYRRWQNEGGTGA